MVEIKWTESLIQAALTEPGNLFNYRQYASVPNISWGLVSAGECDLVCLSKSGVFHEVEIKVTKSDLRKDLKKWRAHQHAIIPYTWFAVPARLVDLAVTLLDRRFGIVEVSEMGHELSNVYDFRTRVIRRPKRHKLAADRKPASDEIIKFLRLGVMRMWTRRTARPQAKPSKTRRGRSG